MKRRLALALAFAGSPKVLLLDEPSSGCDSWTRELVRKDILSRKADTAILVSTHHIDDVEVLSDRVWFLNERYLAFNGPLDDLTSLGSFSPGKPDSAPVSTDEVVLQQPVSYERSAVINSPIRHTGFPSHHTASKSKVEMERNTHQKERSGKNQTINQSGSHQESPNHHHGSGQRKDEDKNDYLGPGLGVGTSLGTSLGAGQIPDLGLGLGPVAGVGQNHMKVDLQFSTWSESVANTFRREFTSDIANTWLMDRCGNAKYVLCCAVLCCVVLCNST